MTLIQQGMVRWYQSHIFILAMIPIALLMSFPCLKICVLAKLWTIMPYFLVICLKMQPFKGFSALYMTSDLTYKPTLTLVRQWTLDIVACQWGNYLGMCDWSFVGLLVKYVCVQGYGGNWYFQKFDTTKHTHINTLASVLNLGNSRCLFHYWTLTAWSFLNYAFLFTILTCDLHIVPRRGPSHAKFHNDFTRVTIECHWVILHATECPGVTSLQFMCK